MGSRSTRPLICPKESSPLPPAEVFLAGADFEVVFDDAEVDGGVAGHGAQGDGGDDVAGAEDELDDLFYSLAINHRIYVNPQANGKL